MSTTANATDTSDQPSSISKKEPGASRRSAAQDGSLFSTIKSKGTGITSAGGNYGNNGSTSPGATGSKAVGNGHSTRNNDRSKKAAAAFLNTPSSVDATTTSSSATNAGSAAGRGSENIEPPQKKIKTGSGLGEGNTSTMKPSPLRSSITTARVSAHPKSTHGAKKSSQPSEETVDIETVETVETVEDGIVSELSVADANKDVKMEDVTEVNDESRNPNSGAGTSQAASGITGAGTSRSKKQAKGITTSTGGGASSRIMADLPTAKPPAPFVIDKNQKARKWGRSSGVFQTLGGELSLPFWTSDQEMLLNEPRPFFVQRTYTLNTTPTTAGNSATATNLARIAVLNQMDNGFYNYDTPERGSTPESGDSSPAPQPVLPSKKKKMKVPQRGIRKSQGGDDNSNGGSRSAGMTASMEAMQMDDYPAPSSTPKTHPGKSSLKRKGAARIAVDEDADNTSARSTPGPSAATPTTTSTGSKPRPIPTRPRTFPCSFEGCTKSFMDKFHLKRHEKRHVTQVITCGVDGCTKAYDSISTMRRHQSMMHRQWKEEMEAAAAAAAASAYAARTRVDGDGDEDGADGDGDGDAGAEDDGEESTPSSPTLSATPFTAASSPMREQV
ncbi:hypothetical protein BG015_011759 [Linnemannia schmuckeri]|uniref:C2H2-type domain-containing protein n=1 Tax=Linnemannia schmuckeri TaxID=64567 RepID=A0A9P5RUA3_9FUNG|nr:hypothetical protein BG015_011759 [Linnemannia schmuckeri]